MAGLSMDEPELTGIYQLWRGESDPQCIPYNTWLNKPRQANSFDIEDELIKSMKNLAATTSQSSFTTVSLESSDLKGAGSGMQLHCLTAEDNLSVVAFTTNEYGVKNGKKMLRELTIKFRDYFSAIDPAMYTTDIDADKPDFDTALHIPNLADLILKWQDPKTADPMNEMERQLGDIKDQLTDNLRLVMERGENLQALQSKTEDLKTTSRSLKKKSKKLNSWWGWLCPAACGGAPNAHSTGPSDLSKMPGKLGTAATVASIAK